MLKARSANASQGSAGRPFRSAIQLAPYTPIIVTICTVIVVLFLSSLSAFALSRYRIPFGRAILLLMLAGNLLPPQILLIPVSKICEMLGIYDHLFALIAVQVGFGMGFFTFVLYGFMRSLPAEVFEAAKIDGAGELRTYAVMVLPLCRPALAALAALESTWVFNDLLWALTVMTFSGWLAMLAGWYVTEIGRQPFIVFGLLRTAEVASNVAPPMIAFTLALYIIVYIALIVSYVGVVKYMAEKPVDTTSGAPQTGGVMAAGAVRRPA